MMQGTYAFGKSGVDASIVITVNSNNRSRAF